MNQNKKKTRLNRAQRRKAEKFKKDKDIEKFVDNFSMDLSKILIDNFEKNKDKDKEEILNNMEKIMKKRGEQFAEVVKKKIMKKQGNTQPIKVNFKG